MASSFHYLRDHMKKEVFQKETFDLDLYIGFHTNFLWALGSLFSFCTSVSSFTRQRYY